MARQNRYIGVLDRFISEGHESLSSFARTGKINFDDKEASSTYYGIMASATKNIIDLDSQKGIETATDKFLSDMSWHSFTDFQQECVSSWTKLFATTDKNHPKPMRAVYNTPHETFFVALFLTCR